MFGPPQKKFLKAAAAGDMETLQHCFDYDIPTDYGISARGSKGKSALHLAAENGQMEAVRFLLRNKADIEATAENGATPLFSAVVGGRTEVAKLLIACGAKVNAHTNDYTYPLHWAANNGDLDVVRVLVEKGADVNAQTKAEERTPLYYAIAQNHGSTAEMLVASGARTDIPGTDGQTDASFAKANNPRISSLMDAAAKAKEPAAPAVTPEPPAPAPVPVPVPDPAPAPQGDSETWQRMGDDKAVHIGVYPDLNRKITEIFNFSTRERRIMTENLKTGVESVGASEKFDTLSDEAIAKAAEALKQLGGSDADKGAKRSFNL